MLDAVSMTQVARLVRLMLPRPRTAPSGEHRLAPGSTWNACRLGSETLWPARQSASGWSDRGCRRHRQSRANQVGELFGKRHGELPWARNQAPPAHGQQVRQGHVAIIRHGFLDLL